MAFHLATSVTTFRRDAKRPGSVATRRLGSLRSGLAKMLATSKPPRSNLWHQWRANRAHRSRAHCRDAGLHTPRCARMDRPATIGQSRRQNQDASVRSGGRFQFMNPVRQRDQFRIGEAKFDEGRPLRGTAPSKMRITPDAPARDPQLSSSLVSLASSVGDAAAPCSRF
jgi:hypothetical protein